MNWQRHASIPLTDILSRTVSTSTATIPSFFPRVTAAASTTPTRCRVGTRFGATYFVPKSALTSSETQQLRSDLTIVMEDNPYSKKRKRSSKVVSQEPFQAYVETLDGFAVPRFYGCEKFGLAATVDVSVGEAMQDGLECTIHLQAQRRQPEAIDRVKCGLRKEQQWGGFLSLPCGFGKTDCAIYVAVNVIREMEGTSQSRRTLVVVPDSGLLEQWQKRIQLRVPGAKVGILRQNKAEIEGSDFVVAMVHSLAKRDTYVGLESFGFMILDEAHHMSAPMFSQALQRVPAKYILALSATPKRITDMETRLLHWFMGPILFKPSRPADSNVLVRMLWYDHTPGKEMRFPHLMLQKMVDDPMRTAILLEVIMQYLSNPLRNILVLSKRRQHLDDIRDNLLRLHVPGDSIGMLHGDISETDRAIQKQRRIVLAIEKLGKEGLDAAHLNTLILALPLAGVEQPIGRIQRTMDEQRDWQIDDADDGKSTYVPPHVVYMVDPYGMYQGIAWNNVRQIKTFGYTIQQEHLNCNFMFQHVKIPLLSASRNPNVCKEKPAKKVKAAKNVKTSKAAKATDAVDDSPFG